MRRISCCEQHTSHQSRRSASLTGSQKKTQAEINKELGAVTQQPKKVNKPVDAPGKPEKTCLAHVLSSREEIANNRWWSRWYKVHSTNNLNVIVVLVLGLVVEAREPSFWLHLPRRITTPLLRYGILYGVHTE